MRDMNDPPLPGAAEQPAPQPNLTTPIWSLVIADMQERDRVGRKKYGTALQAHNGRDALVDAYQEALDLVVYLRQTIEERNHKSGGFTCKARAAGSAGGNTPQDCDWPFCDCDPAANRVLAAIQENGLKVVKE